MTCRRRLGVLAIAVALTVAGCGDPVATGPADRADSGGDAPREHPLPFGLAQIPGTQPIGRPAVYDDVPYTYNGVPVTVRALKAAYRVTSSDPLSVFRAWVRQLEPLHLETLRVWSEPRETARWIEAVGYPGGGGSPHGDTASLQLWATDDGPILLIEITRETEDGPVTTIQDDAGSPAAPTTVIESTGRREAGDLLFEEQGDEIHLPDGAVALMPTIPVSAGTGGSWSVFSAPDGRKAVDAMMDEASAMHPDESESGNRGATPTTEATLDGIEIHTAAFTICCGGWGFRAVSVQGPSDVTATVYVSSFAD